MSDTLTIPVAGKYFDQILAGVKPEEYRLRSPFWRKRLEGRSYRRVVLTRGYPAGGGVEGCTRLTLPWRGYFERTITHEFFGPQPVEVFAIAVPAVAPCDRSGEADETATKIAGSAEGESAVTAKPAGAQPPAQPPSENPS